MQPGDKTNNVHIQPKDYPSASAHNICEALLPEWKDLFLRKNAGYGDMHHELGMAAQFVDMHRKFGKIRRAMWDNEPIGDETLREVLMDMIGHCFLTLDLIGKDNDRDRT